jgi:hypothetical protein
MARTAPSRVYSSPVVLTAGTFTGVSEASEPSSAQRDRLYRAQNVYVTPGSGSKTVLGRPGLDVMEGDKGTNVQWVGQFTLTSGTQYTVAVIDGEIWTHNWGADTWSRQVTTANLLTASVTVSASTRFYAVPFFNTLVFNPGDGTQVPFTWDGTSGAGGLTELTNAPVAYGQPVVYYSKLFFIKNTERDTIAWSEEAAANTGYEAGGYNNAWSLPGTKGEPIVALASRNDSLGVIRTRSTTTIQGAVNDAFTTTGTRAAVSERIGTSSPSGVLVLDEGTVVFDSDGRPQFWPNGGGYSESPAMWVDCVASISDFPRAYLAQTQIVYDPNMNLILIGTATTSTTVMSQWLVFERTGGVPNYVGLWNGFSADCIGMALDTDLVPHWLHGDSVNGLVYKHGTPDDGPWEDGFLAGDTAISHVITGPALGYDIDEMLRFDELSLAFFQVDDTNVAVDYETSRSVAASAQTVALTATAGGLMWDVDDWDEDNWGASGSGELRKRVGLKGYGRWIRPRITHDTISDRLGLELMRVSAFRDGRPVNAA